MFTAKSARELHLDAIIQTHYKEEFKYFTAVFEPEIKSQILNKSSGSFIELDLLELKNDKDKLFKIRDLLEILGFYCRITENKITIDWSRNVNS